LICAHFDWTQRHYTSTLGVGHSDLRRGRSAQSRQRTRASIDEWMATLFWMDSPKPLEAAWSMERVERCWVQIWATASQPPTHEEMLACNGIRVSSIADQHSA